MVKMYVEWNGEKFPVRVVTLPEELSGRRVLIADSDLWTAIENEVENENEDAETIEDCIHFFCDSGFIDSDPTDEEIISVLKDEE